MQNYFTPLIPPPIDKFTNGEWRGTVTLYVALQDVRLDFTCFELHRSARHKQIL